MSRLCIVCGARVTNQNPKANTCDNVCTRAKYHGLSRESQLHRDMEEEIADAQACHDFGFKAPKMIDGEVLH